MLCQFTVQNYKSIRDAATLDMTATGISEYENTIITGKDGEQYLPVASIYGPNGGGKSNVLSALLAVSSFIIRPIVAAINNIPSQSAMSNQTIEPYKFSDEGKKSPTKFELFFRSDTSEYRYVLHIKKNSVLYESLDRIKLDTGRISGLFERSKNNFQLKGILKSLNVSSDLSNSLSLLSYLGIAYRKNPVINDIFNWFEKKVDFINYGNPVMELQLAVTKSKDIKNIFLDLFKEMDLDIVDFRIEEKDNAIIDIYTMHNINGYTEEISLREESKGTQKIFNLLPFLISSLINGKALIVDELDAKLHPLLLKHIITMFTDPSINKRGAQLIFTSHDLSTMNNEVFRRDEIWFVAKGKAQDSQLYSLVEFKKEDGSTVRKDSRYDKQYLEGQYGADPYLQRIIKWGEVNG